MSSGVGAATRTRARPSASVAVGVAVPPELVAQDRHEPWRRSAPSPRCATGARSTSSTTSLPRRGQLEVVGPLGGLGRSTLGRRRSGRPGTCAARVGAGDQVPDVVLVDQAPRVDQPLGALAAALLAYASAHLAPADDRGLQLVDQRGPVRGRARPSGSGRSSSPPAAASASARNVSGSARTSLRSAALASRTTAAAGPTSRNSACASEAVRPLRSVRAPPTSDHPPPRPGCGYTGMPGRGQRLQVAAGGGHRDLQLVGELGGGHPAAGLHQQQGGDEPVGAHV